MYMVDENAPKMPWESKTDMIAFITLITGLAASFGFVGANLTTEQIGGLATLISILIIIARQYGGGVVVWSQAAKEKVIAKQEALAEEKCDQ
jgi:hypothetical protein